jgi:hypothetical protein
MLIMKLTLPSPTTTGPDVLSPQSTEPFFRPDVWKFPSQHGKETSAPKLGSELSPLFDMLCYPKEAAQVKWASIFFQAVSLGSKDISSLPVYEKPTNSKNELSHNVALIEYLISYIDNPRRSLAISGPSSTLPKQNNVKTSFSLLDKLINNIILILLAFSILGIQCKIHKTEQSLVLHSEQFSKLPHEHVSRPQYALLAAFCVSGVRGLFTASTEKLNFFFRISLSFIDFSSGKGPFI